MSRGEGKKAKRVQDGSYAKAVASLKEGLPVVFPTDTVYGIGVSVRHANSPQALYDVKRRDAGKPVAWLVGGPEALDEFGVNVPESARKLVRTHWPGALTVIVKASEAVPVAFQSQEGTIGLRMPDSPVALSLIESVEGPLATSSANLSGGLDPTSFGEVDAELLQAVPVAIDDACPASGIASTVVDCSQGTIEVLRQGAIAVIEEDELL